VKDILQKLDQKIFTPELVKTIQEMVDKEVNLRVAASISENFDENESNLKRVLEAKYSEKAEEYIKQYVDELDEKAEDYITMLDEKAEDYIKQYVDELDEKAEEYVEQYLSTFNEKIDTYIDRIAEAYISENQIAIQDEIKKTRVDAIMEGFSDMLMAAGIQTVDILEASDDIKHNDSPQLKTEVNKLVKENNELKSRLFEAKKDKVLAEASMDLTLSQQDKLSKLSEIINTTNISDYENRLLYLKEGVINEGTASKTSKASTKRLDEQTNTGSSGSQLYERFLTKNK
jgi:hypothetical protein